MASSGDPSSSSSATTRSSPSGGGAQKFSYGKTKEEAALSYEGIRERWARVQNQALEHAGVEARVDHRSLADQGIDREPQVHRGPAVNGIEERGDYVSEVGQRQREQVMARSQARAVVVAEVQVVTREEVAAGRVAMRERRELARGLEGEDLKRVVPLLEADRREQLEHAQAAAERRIGRRQSRSFSGQVKEKLLTQARALRQRLGQELTRVKDWVRERFIEPAGQLKERALEALKARAREAAQGWRKNLHARQQGLEREAQEKILREKTVDRFKDLVVSRSKGRRGFTDRSQEWRQTPEALKQLVDRFNDLTPAAQAQALQRFAQEPERVKALKLQMDQREQIVRSLDRGLER